MKLDLVLLRRALRFALVASIIASVALLALAVALRSFGYVRTQILLTLFGLVTGAIVGDIATGALPAAPSRSKAAFGTLLASQVFYHLLVWTDWKMGPTLWRLWWIVMIASFTAAHLLALRPAAAVRRDWIARATPWCAGLSGALAGTLALWPEAPPKPGAFFLWSYGLLAAGSIVGSIVLWRRHVRHRAEPKSMPRWARVSWALASFAAVFMAGYYVGGVGQEAPSPVEIFPSALTALTPEQVDMQVHADLARLKTAVTGLEDLSRQSATLRAELRARRQAEGREYYKPDEDDRIRWNFATYLSYRAALLRLVATYGGFETVRAEETRARCFTVGYTAAAAAFEYALRFVTTYLDEPTARRKLNEPEPNWGIPRDMFEKIYQSVTGERNQQVCHEMGAYYRLRREKWRSDSIWPVPEFVWLDDRISRSLQYVESHSLSRAKAWLDDLIHRVKKDGYKPIYAAQSMLSEWIGDTKLVQYPPLISIEQLKGLEKRLKPGDIFLERRNWYLSNAFLPGFWPHGALYVGRIEDLRRLGVADRPEVRDRLAEYLKPASDGEPHTVIEAVSEGVIFNSLTESMRADYVAVLRPRLPEQKVAEAIVRAFSHHGKPYDYEFDFFTSDKLVCTELLFRAYEGMIHFELVKVMGRDTLPAVEIVRKHAKERGTPKQELDLILFLEGDRPARCARPATEEAFCATVDRSSVFTE